MSTNMAIRIQPRRVVDEVDGYVLIRHEILIAGRKRMLSLG